MVNDSFLVFSSLAMISCVSALTEEYSESYTVTSALQQFKVETTIQWLLFTGTTCRDPCKVVGKGFVLLLD